jgi:hypothetical protein
MERQWPFRYIYRKLSAKNLAGSRTCPPLGDGRYRDRFF